MKQALPTSIGLGYPEDKLEICIINDRSEDDSSKIIEAAKSSIPTLKIIHQRHVPAGFAPKKKAIDLGIRQTNGEIIRSVPVNVST